MALHMYGVRRLEIRKDRLPEKERDTAQITLDGTPVPGTPPERVWRIDDMEMYWYNARHIHRWFVDNVQDGQDDCMDYHVSWQKLRELLSLCEKVIKASNRVDGEIRVGTVDNQEHPDGLASGAPGKVIEGSAVARKSLPTGAHFFFAGEQYPASYFDDVIDTRDWIVRMLADHDAGVPGDIRYLSTRQRGGRRWVLATR